MLSNKPISLRPNIKCIYTKAIAGGMYAQPLGSLSAEVSLSEHHLYGSSRLGIQHYSAASPAVLTGDDVFLRSNYQYGNAANTKYGLSSRAVWWSYGYNDLVKAGQITPWGQWHNQAYTQRIEPHPSLGIPGMLSLFGTSRTLGMRHYELSDHLGNVLATVLYRKLGHVAQLKLRCTTGGRPRH